MNSQTVNQDAPSRLDAPLPENFFAYSSVFIEETVLENLRDIITAIESVIALPAYQIHVLADAPKTAHFVPKARGVFFGYDFHIDEKGEPKLIEINTNAGGALLNSMKFKAENAAYFVDMFQEEWQLSRGVSQPLKTIAIVDESPQTQYLYAEFLQFKQLFEANGIQAIICAPEALRYHSQKLWYENTPIDLVYNRLTDFALLETNQQALAAAYLADNVVITPHPRAHALYADKRNLAILSNEKCLESFGVDEKTQRCLLNGIASTILVEAKNAQCLWAGRKQLFFKPAKGYGSKAAYRGEKLTKRVFEEILAGDYVAQTFVPPQTQAVACDDDTQIFKVDLRAYVYDEKIQLTCARLYQGQTTNFRTVGGGFARLIPFKSNPIV
ncbi:MAG: hypothetical protein PHQ03_01705 [Methylococcales bacterium]|nr:hypothetical protein [Methylococcales bacterium]